MRERRTRILEHILIRLLSGTSLFLNLLTYLSFPLNSFSNRMMNILVDTCFDKCVNTGWGGGIKSKTLDETEQKCVVNCVEKYFKLANRVSFRWDEHITNVQNQSK